MKFITVLIVIVLSLNYSEQSHDPAWINDCVKQTNVNPALPPQLFEFGILTDDKNLKCFIKCMFIKAGGMTEAGQLEMNNLKDDLPPELTPEEVTKVLNACKDKKGADACETAFLVEKCLIEQIKPLA